MTTKSKAKVVKGLSSTLKNKKSRPAVVESDGLSMNEVFQSAAGVLAALGLAAVAVSRPARRVYSEIGDALVEADERSRDTMLEKERYKTETQKKILDKKLALNTLNAHRTYFSDDWRERHELEGEIRILEDSVRRL